MKSYTDYSLACFQYLVKRFFFFCEELPCSTCKLISSVIIQAVKRLSTPTPVLYNMIHDLEKNKTIAILSTIHLCCKIPS